MSTLEVGLKAVLSLAAAQADLDKFRDEESRRGITEKLKLDTSAVDSKLLETRAKLDKVIGKFTGSADLDGKKALASALALRVKIDAELKKGGNVDVNVRTDKALAQLAKFDAESAVLAKAAGDRSGKYFSDNLVGRLGRGITSLASKIPGIGRLFDGIGKDAEGAGSAAAEAGEEGATAFGEMGSKVAALGPYALAAIPAIAAIGVEATGLLAGFTAAGVGVAAFGALAYPTFKQIIGAIGDSRKQLEKLPAPERAIVEGIRGLEGQIKSLQNQPWVKADVFSIMNSGLKIAGSLLRDVNEFAKPAGSALADIAHHIAQVTNSKDFQAWAKELSGDVKPALEAIATGAGHVIANVGKLLTVMSKKDVVNALNIAFSILDGTIIAMTAVIKFSMQEWDRASKNVANFATECKDAGQRVNSGLIQPLTAWFMGSLPHAWSVAYTGFQNDFWHPISGAAISAKNNILGAFHDVANFFTGSLPHAFESGAHDIDAAVDSATSHISGAWSRMTANVEGWTKDAWNAVTTEFDTGRHDIASAADGAWHDVTSVWNGGVHGIESATSEAWHMVSSVWSTELHDVETVTHDVVSGVEGAFNTFFGAVKAGFTAEVHGIIAIWDTLKSGIEAPINFTLGIVDKVDGFLNKIPGVHLPTGMHLASGGPVTGPGGPRDDKVPAMLSAGEFVVNASSTAKHRGTLEAINKNKFAAGGIVPGGGVLSDIGGAISGAASDIGKGIKDIAGDVLKFGASAVVGKLINPLIGSIPGSGLAKTIVTDMVKSLESALTNAVNGSSGNNGPGVNYKASAGVNQWRSTVAEALKLVGLPISLENQVLYQMETESGGNPNAVNNWDSNAKAGTPSEGLMQVIGPTFARYHVPGTPDSLTNPLANIAAALEYAKATYGPTLMRGGMGLGSGHGYASGGLVMPEQRRHGGIRPFSAGGTVSEPVAGVGLSSGLPYAFAERGSEAIVPSGQAAAASSSAMQGGYSNVYEQKNQTSLLQAMNKQLQQLTAVTKSSSGGAGRGQKVGYYS